MVLTVACAFAAQFAAHIAHAAPAAAPDWNRLLECRAAVGDYHQFVLEDFQNAAYQRRIGVTPVRQGNPFLNEYALGKPLDMAGYRFSHVVFSASGVMAILDEPDAAALAEKLQIPIAMRTSDKIMASQTVSETEMEPLEKMRFWHRVSRELSTVSSHPGKTLLGCSYRVISKETP